MTAFRFALDQAFNEGSLQLLVQDYFGRDFQKISSAGGIGKQFGNRLQELIDAALMEDWLFDLVAAAHERRPKNVALTAIAEDLGLTSIGPRLINQTQKPLQQIIQENAKSINPAVFRERMASLEGQVCWINIPGGGGTGFLIGPDLVLTNQHVIARITDKLARSTDVVCRFDYRQALGTVPAQKKPTEVRLAENWLVDSQPPSDADWDPKIKDATQQESDYAVVRLADRIGDAPVGGATADAQAPPRKWIDTTDAVPALTSGNQIFLLQHPRGEPLQLTIGTVKEFNQKGTRVRYDANSKDGSSGAPCFDADLNLVALHHAHDISNPPAWNQGIPFSVIKSSWKLQ